MDSTDRSSKRKQTLKGDEESEASIGRPSEDYADDDIDENIRAFWDWLKREKIPAHGWITALSSVALLAVTFGQLVIAWENYNQTNPLVDYARRNTEAAEKFSTAADKINTGVGQAVRSLSDQAGYAKQNLSDTKAAVHLDESPWVNILGLVPKMNPDGSETLTVVITNTGRSPAFSAHVATTMVVIPGAPPTFTYDEKEAKGTSNLTSGALYNVTIDTPSRPEVVSAYRAGLTHPYVGVAIWYRDAWNQKQMVKFCLTYGLNTKGWVDRKPDHCQD